jgi:hypothetical protein
MILKNLLPALLLSVTACVTNPITGEPELDLGIVHKELIQIQKDLDGAIAIFGMESETELVETLMQIKEAAALVDAAVVSNLETGEPFDFSDVIGIALQMIPEVHEVSDDNPENTQQMRLLVFGVRTVLERIQLYSE